MKTVVRTVEDSSWGVMREAVEKNSLKLTEKLQFVTKDLKCRIEQPFKSSN